MFTARKQSLGNVKFSEACVILFTRGSLSRERVSVRGRVSVKGVYVQDGLCQAGLCPGGLCPGVSLSGRSLSRGVSVQKGLCSGRSLSMGGVSLQGRVSVQGRVHIQGEGCHSSWSLSRRVYVHGSLSRGSLARGSLSMGVSVQWEAQQRPLPSSMVDERVVIILFECCLVSNILEDASVILWGH